MQTPMAANAKYKTFILDFCSLSSACEKAPAECWRELDGSDGATIDGVDGSDDGNAANGMKVVNGRVDGFIWELDGCVRSDGAVVEGEFDGSVTDGYFDGEGEGFAVGTKDGEVVVG